MKLTYTIGTHNEGDSIETLLNLLVSVAYDNGDEILIIDDFSTDEKTLEIINSTTKQLNHVKLIKHALNGNFAEHKNFMTSQATGDFIFNIDADEFPSDYLIYNIKTVLEQNPVIDLYWLPRVNIVEGITDEDIKRYGWNINEKGYINWPDYQGRIYRKSPNIVWKNKVHEILTGANQYAKLPDQEPFALYHVKTIEKQRQQNEFYAHI